MRHTFFAEIDFLKLEAKELVAPFVPSISHAFDTSNFDEIDDEEEGESDEVWPQHALYRHHQRSALAAHECMCRLADLSCVDRRKKLSPAAQDRSSIACQTRASSPASCSLLGGRVRATSLLM